MEEMNIENSKTEWNGSEIEIQAKLIPKYLWTTASIDVRLEGQFILKTGGKLKIIGAVTKEFEHKGMKHQAELSWDRATRRYFPYQLKIDNLLVSESNVFIQNWRMAYTIWVIFGAAIGIWISHR